MASTDIHFHSKTNAGWLVESIMIVLGFFSALMPPRFNEWRNFSKIVKKSPFCTKFDLTHIRLRFDSIYFCSKANAAQARRSAGRRLPAR